MSVFALASEAPIESDNPFRTVRDFAPTGHLLPSQWVAKHPITNISKQLCRAAHQLWVSVGSFSFEQQARCSPPAGA